MKPMRDFNPKQILCPVDFSELSDLALKYAAAGALAYRARLTLLHVTEAALPPYFTATQSAAFAAQDRSLRASLKTTLREHVRKILGRELANRLAPVLEVVPGHPLDRILSTARRIGADLIVMWTHGRGGARRLWLGSVVENVVRHSTVPVFVVRQKEHEFIDPAHPDAVPRLTSVLCPVNFTPAAQDALRVAASVSRRFNSSLATACFREPGRTAGIPNSEKERDAWFADALGPRCEVEPVYRKGRAAEQIVALAAKARADLIVLGAQRRASLGTWLWGSTTEVVLRNAPAPVLVVPRA